MIAASHGIELSIVAPAHNEAQNLETLVREVAQAAESLGRTWEFLIVDDGSTDNTQSILQRLLHAHQELRCIRMTNTPRGKGNGQSAAFHAGFRASRGKLIAVLDADCQNDPADIPAMIEMMERTEADLVQGDRSHARADSPKRIFSSWVGRTFRRLLLGDTIRDTGCSLRIMKRDVALALPLEFRGMHRFIPLKARHLGFKVVEIQVSHRPRTAGVAKYGMWNRALPGLIDCFAVGWMCSRRRPVTHEEVRVSKRESAPEESSRQPECIES